MGRFVTLDVNILTTRHSMANLNMKTKAVEVKGCVSVCVFVCVNVCVTVCKFVFVFVFV